MKVTQVKYSLPGPLLIEYDEFHDYRGSFMEMFKKSKYIEMHLPEHFVQDNVSYSTSNVIRGLHAQPGVGKLVTCFTGVILDVAVNIQKDSLQFGQYVAVELSYGKALWIPPGFAHGFSVISQDKAATVFYKCTKEYDPKKEIGILYNDKDLNINWKVKKPILSEKDRNNMSLREYDAN